MFSAGPGLGDRRASHTATVLTDGRVLIAGGLNGNTALASAVLIDPVSGAVRATGSLQQPRGRHTATLLKDGRVLIAGGFAVSGSMTTTPMDSAEIYDPASGQFTAVGNMTSARAYHAAALLPDGRVLICGGAGAVSGTGVTPLLNTAELFDPATGRFTAAANMMAMRSGHTATTLDTGQVLVTSQGTAELYDPATNRFSKTGNPIQPRGASTATLLRDGQVLLVGGLSANVTVAVVERYDPRAGSFQITGSLATSRHDHTATLLPDGRVLVAGGRVMTKSPPGEARPYTSSVTPTAEMYDPVAGTFSATASLAAARGGHAAAVTSNGVWITGGIGTMGLSSSEVFAATTPLSASPGASAVPTRAGNPPSRVISPPAGSAPGEARQYSNQDHRYSIAYPRDWRLEDRDREYVKISSPGDSGGLVGIHVALFDRERVNVDDFAATVMAGESRRPGFKILSRQHVKLADGTSALEIVNVLGVKPQGKSRKVFVIAGHRGFAVNAETYFDAWPAFEAAFDRVITSFKVAPPTWQSRLEDAQQLAVDGVAVLADDGHRRRGVSEHCAAGLLHLRATGRLGGRAGAERVPFAGRQSVRRLSRGSRRGSPRVPRKDTGRAVLEWHHSPLRRGSAAEAQRPDRGVQRVAPRSVEVDGGADRAAGSRNHAEQQVRRRSGAQCGGGDHHLRFGR